MLRLRCKSEKGTQLLQGLSEVSSLRELQERITALTGIPGDRQRILRGFPPQRLELGDDERSLGDCAIRSGDTLIVEESKTKPASVSPSVPMQTAHLDPGRETLPELARKMVPADNSCLFTSVYYVVEGGVYEPACAPEMRSLIAQIVASDPEYYCQAVLGKTNEEYCDWIRREDTWGGAIEISILSKFYQCEICVVDTQSVRIDRFGEDVGYTKRVLLIYDGIHYDPLQRKFTEKDIPPLTIFSCTDDVVLAEALELADEARRKRQFTDVNRFTLRCMVCQKGLTGQAEAREHARDSGHTNFGEV
ncbi:LOW QUALITY PROTEIN: ubiquitin thioesterase OTU1-like [Rhinatrema bivittatum]|uniref:ubiquitin thioesterase OTU1-like n=1 Tax=Rhinatrema bivittatum TaxID=194408 RepID=UPI00112AF3C0|nr:ubiquitin thioesterase OTU1-like [Rhinatrema bivittatum]XP_029429811.1 LOW QUALITY PROTEIN: ubiquitin thioesterase OTU1-like [Rhinatrema bivittatum]